MNIKNNKRKRDSIEKINKAFILLIQEKELKDVTVTEICEATGLNRSTFYANFLDVYDLAEKIKINLQNEFNQLFLSANEEYEKNGAVKMFKHIKDNQLFYKTYFKLGGLSDEETIVFDKVRAKNDFDNKHIEYHIDFFKNGLNAIIKRWLNRDCKETPEEMAEIIKSEYKGR